MFNTLVSIGMLTPEGQSFRLQRELIKELRLDPGVVCCGNILPRILGRDYVGREDEASPCRRRL